MFFSARRWWLHLVQAGGEEKAYGPPRISSYGVVEDMRADDSEKHAHVRISKTEGARVYNQELLGKLVMMSIARRRMIRVFPRLKSTQHGKPYLVTLPVFSTLFINSTNFFHH